ncbi:hypothetical protein OHF21_06815 [Escherichia coli]|uniref:hypothetical protein n=1 Tax=Escherichia coli TaxID=562 RepID=UPI00164F43E6|nr:hypothetical protein [Escherichia coli]EFA4450877.1 hypothetical protein [Escherichia coli]EFB2231630.1 hypothetical protein [Escherichia coli]EFO0423939.1 hypothetical protein [Escherichia coli]MCV2999266.1 hypothetical protein [Escherichia coli]MCV5074088.1 hypothetical protein [Escherichia coli]
MESNIKGLVSAGHEMASELKAECGAVDMRSVAKLISDLATQLEVQLVRANALAEDQQKAIESIKQADAAVKLAHEKFSALAAENAGMKKFCKDAAFDADYEAELGMERGGFSDALNEIKTPATDAFLAEVRAQGVEMLAKNHQSIVNALKGDSLFSDGECRHAAIVSAAVYFAAELRKGGSQ